ncbi:MAG: hypothetical protein D6718_03155 [Acidobacteria bacterium]|nr:MAG: hypothetical protein D6718_03155 [Acidobacteriota bacterium]
MARVHLSPRLPPEAGAPRSGVAGTWLRRSSRRSGTVPSGSRGVLLFRRGSCRRRFPSGRGGGPRARGTGDRIERLRLGSTRAGAGGSRFAARARGGRGRLAGVPRNRGSRHRARIGAGPGEGPVTTADRRQPTLEALCRRFGAERAERIAPDASTRAFYRLHRRHGTAVLLVDERGGPAAAERMVRAHGLLAGIGVPVPALLDREESAAALLFEDAGSCLLAEAWPELPPARRRVLYEELAAIAAAIAVEGTARLSPGDPLAERPLGRERLRIELAMFAVHDVAGRRGVTDRGLLGDLSRLLDRIAAEAAACPREFSHRDLHSRNVMLAADGGLRILDFQDALLAPRHYDIASLLLDPYVDLTPDVREAAAERYRNERGFTLGLDADPRFPWVGLQRMLKAIGTYAFQASRARRPRFLAHIPPAEQRALELCDRLSGPIGRLAKDLLEKIGFTRNRTTRRG